MGGSQSRKMNTLVNLIKHKDHDDDDDVIDEIYSCVKDPNEAKYQYLIRKLEKLDPEHYENSKGLTEYLNNMQDVYKYIV